MSYAIPAEQGSMVMDHHRNGFYFRALKEVITPDSVVMDLGAGVGTLGLIAASLGAKQVYLVEPATDLAVAEQVARANNLADRITCIPAAIETAEIDEPVDVLLSVFTGNFLVEEDLLPSLFLARDRFLKPGGTMIPFAGRSMVQLVEAPEPYREQVGRWSDDVCGVSFESIRRYALNELFYGDLGRDRAQRLGDAQVLMNLDFRQALSADCDATVELTVSSAGTCHGIAGWFDMSGGSETLSTSPYSEQTHWSQVLIPLPEPLQVAPGDVFSVRVVRPAFGTWSWVIETGDKRFTGSTAFRQPVSPAFLSRHAGGATPTLNPRGEAAKLVLTLMDGNTSNEQINAAIGRAFPALFSSPAAVAQFVSSVTGGYVE